MINANRVKFLLAGPVLEAVNPRIPGRPHDELVGLVGQEPGARILELCAGTGYVSRLVAQANPTAEVHGIDVSPEMLAVGRRRLGGSGLAVTLTEGDAARLPYPDASFDVVTVAFGLHELPPGIRRAAMAESARVLRSGGRLVAMDIDRPSGIAGLLTDVYLWIGEPRGAGEVCGSGLRRLLTESGFAITHHRPASNTKPTQTAIATKP